MGLTMFIGRYCPVRDPRTGGKGLAVIVFRAGAQTYHLSST